jgi:DNA-binding NtrC family response regulator
MQDVDVAETLPNRQHGTLILRNLETLEGRAQHELLHWLNEAGAATRVVSLTPADLYPLVELGTFLDALYYRLNVFRVGPI